MCKLLKSNLFSEKQTDYQLCSENLFFITIIVNIIEMIKH